MLQRYSACRFKCRAHAAELAAAKAQTQYFPEGPQADDEPGNDATQGAAPSFKKRRIDGGSGDNSRNFWDCFFRQTKCNVKKREGHNRTPHQHHPCGSSGEEEEDDEQCPFGSWDSDSAFDCGSDDCDDDEEEEGENSAGNQQQQHPQQFYKQAAPVLGPPEAFQQLVHFVQGLPTKVKDQKSAAHLKGFASKKVSMLQVQ